MNWDRKLSELELRALCDFVLNPENSCRVIAEKENPTFQDEGLRQTLYAYDRSNEYVFIVRQKGYIMNALHIGSDEIEVFKTLWERGLLTPYGQFTRIRKKKISSSQGADFDKQALELLGNIAKTDSVEGIDEAKMEGLKAAAIDALCNYISADFTTPAEILTAFDFLEAQKKPRQSELSQMVEEEKTNVPTEETQSTK